MSLFFWSIVGGLIGTGLMDIVGTFATDKLKIRWGAEEEMQPSVGGFWVFLVDIFYIRI
jgi:hypothetical protein